MSIFFSAIGLFMAPVPAAELRPFDFLGFVAGEPIEAKKLKGCGKGGDVTCINSLVQIAGVYVGYMLEVRSYKVSSLYIDAHPNNFTTLLEAFTAKYGAPCKADEGVWANAMGAKIANPTYQWCFSTGKMTFSKYGSRIDKMGILYEDDNKPPKAPPVVNF